MEADSPRLVATARVLFREYAEAIGTDLEYQGFSAELAALPVPYVPPKGTLLVAYAGTDVAGCVGLRSLDSRTGEMKRLYVRSAYRSLGLGKRLVEAVIHAAKRAEYNELRLDTCRTWWPLRPFILGWDSSRFRRTTTRIYLAPAFTH